MNRLGSDRTFVSRLRVRSALNSAERAHLSMAFGAASLEPSGLGPSALVCIRRLSDPRPGTLRPNQMALQLPAQWLDAARAAIDDKVRHASRPSRGHVPDNAECVVFADEAEAIACLATDWCDRRVSGRWWWKMLFKSPGDMRAVVQYLFQSIEYLPAAFEYLAAQAKAVRFARMLAPADASSLLDQVALRFGLRELQSVAKDRKASSSNLDDVLDGARPGDASPSNDAPTFRETATGRVVSPWSLLAPEADHPSLLPEQSALLGTALVLRRMPLAARSKRFADKMQAWRSAKLAPAGGRAQSAEMLSEVRVLFSAPSGSDEIRFNGFDTGNVPSSQDEVRGRDAIRAPEQSELRKRTGAGQEELLPFIALAFKTPAESTAASGRNEEARQVEPIQPAAGASVSGAAKRTKDVAEENPAPALSALPSNQPIDTEFGGVFYLLNVGIFLGYYADFASSPNHDLSTPIWDFSALIGRELAGPRLEEDPVWLLLAQLAGRDPVGPLEWPEELPADLMTTLRDRLAAALGCNDPEVLGALVCRHRARVFATATHVDVMLSLASLPIEIRLSGLDRNPAWIPSAGKFVTFHFD